MGDLKRAAQQQNLDRFTREGRRLEAAFGLAAGHEGHALIQRHIDTLVDVVRRSRAFARLNRETYFMRSLTRAVFDLVAGIPDEDLAQAAITGALNCTRVPPRKKGERERGPGRAAKEHVGAELERAARAHYLRTRHPALLEAIERATSYKSKLGARLVLERKLLKAKRVKFWWSKPDRLDVGNWGLDCCLQALPNVIVTRQDGPDTVPDIADEAWDTAVLMATQNMLRHPIHTPSLQPPPPWG